MGGGHPVAESALHQRGDSVCGAGNPPPEALALLQRLKELRRRQAQVVQTDTCTRIIYRPDRVHFLPPDDVIEKWRARYR